MNVFFSVHEIIQFSMLSLVFYDLDNFEKCKSGNLKCRTSLNLDFPDIFSWVDESYRFEGRMKFKWGHPITSSQGVH